MSSAITITHLRKDYEAMTAVEDLSFAVPSGCIYGLLGPNGSGKSTTLGCATGVLEPTSGGVALFGEALSPDAIELKRRIGVMPEGLALFDALYAHEFLAFQAAMFGLDAQTTCQRVSELLEAMGLAGDGRKPLAEFSAGMRKRVAFAAALIHRPEILFLDEPFESIDPEGVAVMKTWLHRFIDRGGTILITSHVLETVERLCDRVAIIRRPGTLVWEGEISSFRHEQPVVVDGREFATLETLFLTLVGQRYTATMDWL